MKASTTPIIFKQVTGASTTLPVLPPAKAAGIHRKAHNTALVILAFAAAHPDHFQMGYDQVRQGTYLSCQEMKRGMNYLMHYGYAGVVTLQNDIGQVDGKAYSFDFSGKIDQRKIGGVRSWRSENGGPKKKNRAKLYSSNLQPTGEIIQLNLPKPYPTEDTPDGKISPAPPYNVALEYESLNPLPPAEAGESTLNDLTGNLEKQIEAQLSILPETANKLEIQQATLRFLQANPVYAEEVQAATPGESVIFRTQEELANFEQMHRRYGFTNPYEDMPDLALGRQGALLAFLRGDAASFDFRKWMLSPGPTFTARQAFYEPVEKLAKLPCLRSGGASEFMSSTLCGLILQDCVTDELPYGEVRQILRQLRRGNMQAQQVLRAWLHTRLHQRVESLQLLPLLASSTIDVNNDDPFALCVGVTRWKRTWLDQSPDKLQIQVEDQLERSSDVAQTLQRMPAPQQAVAWSMSLFDTTPASTCLRQAFVQLRANPTFMALQLLKFSEVVPVMVLGEVPQDERGHNVYASVLGSQVYRTNRWQVELNRLMCQLLENDANSFDAANMTAAKAYAV